jgi:shikimate kinase
MGDAIGQRIAIAGPPASGKTACGRILAELLGTVFVDLDTEIGNECGRSIGEIFGDIGEPGFRRIESLVLSRVLSRPGGAVIALGGGTLLDPGNMSLVLERAVLLSLNVSRAGLAGRAAGDRPLAPDQESLAALLDTRWEHYSSLPNRIDCDGLTPGECARAAMELLEHLAGGLDARRL